MVGVHGWLSRCWRGGVKGESVAGAERRTGENDKAAIG